MKDYSDKDVEFVQAMIPHHEAAVEMAAHEWVHGENSEIKQMALDIFSGQRNEIDKFRAWLKDRGIAEKKPKPSGGM